MGKSVRMADIAERLNISVESVSKALAGKRGVSEEMRAKVVALAKEMGYELSKTSREPAGASSIGVLVEDHYFSESPFYANLYRGLVLSGTEAGCTCTMEIILPEAERELVLPSLVTGRKVDALIFMGGFSLPYIKSVIECGLPFVLLDFYIPGFFVNSVVSDNINGGYILTKYLLDQGRREIGFIGSANATSSIMNRYLGYQWAMQEAEIPLNPDWIMEDRDENGDLTPITLPEKLPQGFVCSCDEVAYHLVDRLREAGRRVPADLAVCGYDDARAPTLTQPNLTTYRVSLERMARTAVWNIQQQLQHGQTEAVQFTVPGELVVREST